MTTIPGPRGLISKRAFLQSATALIALSVLQTSASAKSESSIVIKGKDGWLFGGWGSLTEVDTAKIDRNIALITQAQTWLARQNVRLQVLMLPEKMVFYANKLPDGKTISPAVQTRYQLILDKLQQADIDSFDDAAVFKQVQQSGSEVFYRTDQHWTLPAADATAEATAQMVHKAVPTLAGQAGSGQPLGNPANERRYGDLAELFLTADEKKQVGREVYTIRRQAESQSLLDDAPAPVHVTGHSMVQPYFGFPQKLSNLLDRPVSLNWKPGNIGPWVVLLEYLESPAFQQHKPQVLVWQLFEPTFSQGPDAAGLWDNASIMPPEAWLTRVQAATAR